ncbi:putative C6 transcription factor [Pseudomassariella vexata]|uniref:Putative C6 transcription factor n=1 Tax=Pseudomassariella vexata TaxID=1141098 RepID=A0A1Y2DSU9_9PEZI|nr:putative C6 transcription factor [Pseudomassariella vexata]ORY61735.1 putative C6 transcription factor [Pseudomassariella vexata]
MVFRGRPSKACERCRTRRLKCDLRSETCGQCIRAHVSCSGYRDTQKLRIWDESQSVALKAQGTNNSKPASSPPFPTSHFQAPDQPALNALPLSIDLQARFTFFSYYIDTQCWFFLRSYYHPTDSPAHLTLAIEAVALAYLWHKVNSKIALNTARERYVSALRTTNKALVSSQKAVKDVTTLLASLLLDLFEKITASKPRTSGSWACHVSGALGLVQLRGVERFRDPEEVCMLVRLTTNYTMSCVASGEKVPDVLRMILAYIGTRRSLENPMLRLTDLMMSYADLRSEIQSGTLAREVCVEKAMELDARVRELELDLSDALQHSTTPLVRKSARSFEHHWDSYSNSKICQAMNMLRFFRILLNEYVVDHFSALSPDVGHLATLASAHDTISKLVREICASVPQYVDCDGAAQDKLPSSDSSFLSEHTHAHTLSHQSACYTLIFALYVAGTRNTFPEARGWVIEQLHHIGSHFHSRNAEIVAQMLEGGAATSPWEVFAMLGSYAVAA